MLASSQEALQDSAALASSLTAESADEQHGAPARSADPRAPQAPSVGIGMKWGCRCAPELEVCSRG